MKKVLGALSALMLATACFVPSLAWAAGPSITLESNGALRVTDMAGAHSVLVEVAFSGPNASKVTDVELKDAPSAALASAVYANGKATVAVSAGDDVLRTTNGSLGTLVVVAQGASAAEPVAVNAQLTAVEYLDTDDVTAAVQNASVNSNGTTLISTQGAPTGDADKGNIGASDDEHPGIGHGIVGDNTSAGNGATAAADYKAIGVVAPSRAGQSAGGSTGLVKTGDVLAICGIALGAAAVVMVVMMLVTRKKSAPRE